MESLAIRRANSGLAARRSPHSRRMEKDKGGVTKAKNMPKLATDFEDLN